MVPLGDGDKKDEPQNLCVDVVESATGTRRSGAEWAKELSPFTDRQSGITPRHLPRCLDLITADEVIRRIALYFDGGSVRYLTDAESDAASLCEFSFRERTA